MNYIKKTSNSEAKINSLILSANYKVTYCRCWGKGCQDKWIIAYSLFPVMEHMEPEGQS